MSLIDELEKLAKAATPGPWHWMFAHPGYVLFTKDEANWILDGVSDGNDHNIQGRDQDRAFIAAANPQTVLKLLRVVRAAREYQRIRNRVAEELDWNSYDELFDALEDLDE